MLSGQSTKARQDKDQRIVILVSIAAIDGYPPTRYQARLLAEAGYRVLALTSTYRLSKTSEFDCAGVEILRIPTWHPRKIVRLLRRAKFAATLVAWRFRYRNRVAAEIAYNPDSMFWAHRLPGRTAPLVAHFHEMLHDPDGEFYERQAVENIHRCGLVVSADEDRAIILQRETALPVKPTVVRNVPLIDPSLPREPAEKSGVVSVAYHGAIGPAIPLLPVVRSMPLWPGNATFHIYGDPDNALRSEVDAVANELGVADRVRFEGWVSGDDLVKRLRAHTIGFTARRAIDPSHLYSAGASNKRFQFMQAGLPQIADKHPGVPALIEGNQIGICVDGDNIDEIARAVEYYANDLDAARAAGGRALHLHLTDLHYEKEFEPVLDFIAVGAAG